MNHRNSSQTSTVQPSLAKPAALLALGALGGLLLTLILTSASHAQVSYEVGQVGYAPESSAPGFASFATGYEVQDSHAAWADGSSQQSYAPQPLSTFPPASVVSSPASAPKNVQPGLAQQKAEKAARTGVKGHIGGGLGGAKYEGVGWSNHSAQNAIHSCCYWGARPTAQVGITKGNDGFWYACVLYH